MAILERTGYRLKHPGPYLAIVKNHLDIGFNGALEVALIKGYTDDTDAVLGQYVKVKHLSPFAGNTSQQFNGPTNTFNDTQKSYGMWMVPPDVNSVVMCFFIDGFISDGYWFGCVTDKFTNQMVPGIGSISLPKTSVSTLLSSDQQQFFGDDPGPDPKNPDPQYPYNYLPVAEINKNLVTDANTPPLPPVHVPFATQLANQGLLYDRVRGGTSSSARREAPSAVFGISTPGPFDTNTNYPTGYQHRTDSYGGKGFEKSIPTSRLGGNQFVMDDGDINGDNELIRLRTRTGIQILLHTTKDLVYISNSQGTSWIEMTSQGKLDIFCQDSVSIHSEADFNLRADRNFNIEAGQDVNIKAFNNLNIDVSIDLNTLIAGNAKLTGNGGIFLNSKGSILTTAAAEVGITGSIINFSGPVQGTSADWLVPNPATSAASKTSTAIPINTLPYNQVGAGWGNNAQYKAGTFNTIVKRMPVHEPWSQHEDIDPVAFSSVNTDNTQGMIPITGTSPQPLTVELAPVTPGQWSPAANAATNSISFTQGTGDLVHFLKCQPALQTAVQQAADTYKQSTGLPLVLTSSYRNKAEQQAIYNRWKAAGGGPGVPTAAGLTTPVNPAVGTSAHMQGVAIDTPQAQWLYQHGVLPACGLQWPLGLKDKVHITLVNAPDPKDS